MEKNKDIKVLSTKKPNIADWTNCKSTAQMLKKARVDQVETAFDRAAGMKPCPYRRKICLLQTLRDGSLPHKRQRSVCQRRRVRRHH